MLTVDYGGGVWSLIRMMINHSTLDCHVTFFVSRCDPHGRFNIVKRPGGAAHSCAAGHTTCDKLF